MFYSELLDTFVKAKEDNYNTENLILEINSLKWVFEFHSKLNYATCWLLNYKFFLFQYPNMKLVFV